MIKIKKENVEEREPKEAIGVEQTIDNKLEILRFVSTVQSRIKKDISEDFVLAKLEDKDREGIIEMKMKLVKILDLNQWF